MELGDSGTSLQFRVTTTMRFETLGGIVRIVRAVFSLRLCSKKILLICSMFSKSPREVLGSIDRVGMTVNSNESVRRDV